MPASPRQTSRRRRPNRSQGHWSHRSSWLLLVVVQRRSAFRLVLDRWICRRIVVAANGLGERRFVFFSVLVLFREVPHRLAVEILPASLFAARALGSSPRFANRSDQTEFRDRSGDCDNRVDDPHVEQQRSMDSQLGVELAGVVSGCDSTKI